MFRFFLSRIAQTIAVLFTVSVIIFALMRLIPGDPILMMLGDDFTQDAYRRLQIKLGLDRSIVVQYLIWLGNILRGEFGDSYLNQEPVRRLVWDAFQPTLVLVVASLIVGVLIALPSGIVAAMRKNSPWDWGSMGFATLCHLDGAQRRGHRRRRSFMLPILGLAMHGRPMRCRAAGSRLGRRIAVGAGSLALLAGATLPAHGQDALPAITLVLSLEVRDHETWLGVYQEILTTPPLSPKPLLVTIVPRTPRRSITLTDPRFTAAMNAAKGQTISVTVRGSITGTEGVLTLPDFMRALFDPTAGGGPSTVRLDYGLSHLTADLVQIKMEER